MSFWQKLARLFGAKYILIRGQYGRFKVARVRIICNMCYVRAPRGENEPLPKTGMANSIQQFYEALATERYTEIPKITWFPLNKRVLATYHMISEESE